MDTLLLMILPKGLSTPFFYVAKHIAEFDVSPSKEEVKTK